MADQLVQWTALFFLPICDSSLLLSSVIFRACAIVLWVKILFHTKPKQTKSNRALNPTQSWLDSSHKRSNGVFYALAISYPTCNPPLSELLEPVIWPYFSMSHFMCNWCLPLLTFISLKKKKPSVINLLAVLFSSKNKSRTNTSFCSLLDFPAWCGWFKINKNTFYNSLLIC